MVYAKTIWGGLVLAALALAAQLTLTAPAHSATPSTPYDFERIAAFDPQPEGRFGDRMKSAGDLNGDGVGDVWIGVYDFDIGTLQNVGRVYALSGRDRSELYRIDSPEPQGQTQGPFFGFGWSVSNLGDIDGDGVNDLVVGSVRHNVNPTTGEPCAPGPGCNVQQGRAWVFSGAPAKPKAPLYVLDNPRPQAFGAFGWASTAGDIAAADGSPGHDGKSEILVGAFQNDVPAGCGGAPPAPAPPNCRKDQGQAFIFNGANGALLPAPRGVVDVPVEDRYVDPTTGTCDSPPPPGQTVARPTGQRCGALGIVNEGLGDVDGDGFWDQSVTAWTTGINPTTGEACLGTNPPTSGDPCNERQGRIYVYSGSDGRLLHKIDNPEPQQDALFGLQIVEAGAPGDVNGDGKADIYGNGFVQNTAQTDGPAEGKSWVFNGPDGRLLYGLTDPTPEPGGQFGYSLAKTDYDKDGLPDLYIGSSPHHVPGSPQVGGTYVFGGRTGSLLRIFDLPLSEVQVGTAENAGPQLGRSVAAPGDLNGDGEPDYLAGAPTYDVGDSRNVGRLYAFLSAPVVAPPPPPPPAGPAPDAGAKFTAKLSIARATINRSQRVLDVLAPITSRASGRVSVQLHAANRRFRFTAPINSVDARIRFRKRIPAAQAQLGTGIVTIAYAGDSDTRPQTVRLRAASRKANLRLERPRIVNGRIQASGTVNPLARGVVRLQLEYVRAGNTSVLRFRAPIKNNGRWSLNEQLSQTARLGIAQRQGTVHSYTLFTGYYERRIRGEMRSFQVLPAQ